MEVRTPNGWLLAYCAAYVAVAVGIAYEANRHQSATLLFEASGFFTTGILLWLRSRWALIVNGLLAILLLGVGIAAFRSTGRPGLIIGGICALASYWPLRDELEAIVVISASDSYFQPEPIHGIASAANRSGATRRKYALN